MSKTKIYLIHGYTASPTSNWFPSFKKELLNENVEIIILDMPNSKEPKFKEWANHMEKMIINDSENTIFIGHSLGCVTVLNYLNSNKQKNIKGLFLISGFVDETPIPELEEFIQPTLDYQYIINSTKNRIAISAKDDDIIPFQYSKRMANKLDAKFILLNEGKHFIDRDNFLDFPFLVNEVRKLID
ncbi:MULTISPECIES: RBBP9/YdeN family alpha/beta hydrolase [unclassified Tenacibaculum]|uniref:RBBP9/YdeN family alpha/beta hydrolase n=1 Tax=unclassified Tenacibaculum TaxID=2635139 RepID=UPI001F3CEC69|nr:MULTISPECIES: alpha/beta hydrolase [unclassified Tenacibaculum]MCF2874069.1 alpha/beta hydrolase [Tenacibaculum sp. Cn5-1]MCF2934650.1 alpha/beta hydrolase [Tenacibaculum sp. Cn5-34]MCG7510860.1 alpha/beta hydrolase [Tenacibaculum sp. Cn5-46]